jgi:hypothetical protein
MTKETIFQFPPSGHVALCVYDAENDQWVAWQGNDTGAVYVNPGAIRHADVLDKLFFNDTATTEIYTYSYANYTAGYLWIIESLWMQNLDSAGGPDYLGVSHGGYTHRLAWDAAPAAKEPIFWSGRVTVKYNQNLVFYWSNLADGDRVEAGVHGFLLRAET